MKDGEEEDECYYNMNVLWYHLSKVKGWRWSPDFSKAVKGF